MFAVLIIGLLIALLVRLPTTWLALSFGYEEPLRLVLVLLALYLWRWLRDLAIAILPRAPVLVAGYLSFRSGGHRWRLRARDLIGIEVVAVPPDDREVFVIEFKGGDKHTLCPVAWRGAGRLYRRLRRYVRV